MINASAAKFFGDCRTKKAKRAHIFQQSWIKRLIAEIANDAWHQNVIGKCLGGIANHTFFIAKLCLKEKRIVPLKLWL